MCPRPTGARPAASGEEFGVDPGPEDGSPYAGLNRFLLDTHADNKLAVVVVDEAQHLGREIEAPLVMVEAQHLVGVIGVEALGLQLVGAHLVGQAVAPPLLVQIEQHAAAILGHEAGGVAQLVAAVAFQAAEEIPRQAG